jgi:hypothetical protein
MVSSGFWLFQSNQCSIRSCVAVGGVTESYSLVEVAVRLGLKVLHFLATTCGLSTRQAGPFSLAVCRSVQHRVAHELNSLSTIGEFTFQASLQSYTTIKKARCIILHSSQ